MRILKFNSDFRSLAETFMCGNIIIDNFLKSSDAFDLNLGITYIMLPENEDIIIGYYNISAGRVDQIEQIGDFVRYIPMGGAININYLAIAKDYQRINITQDDTCKAYLGDYLLHDCEKRIFKLREFVGASFITLYSTKEGYHLYHERNSYENFDNDMSTFVPESDKSCYKLYKWIDDIIT